MLLGIIANRINPELEQRVKSVLIAIEDRQSDGLQSAVLQLLSDVHTIVIECSCPDWSSSDLYNAVVFNE